MLTSIFVGVRVRPYNSREKKSGASNVVEMNPAIPGHVSLHVTRHGRGSNEEPPRQFQFDAAFWSHEEDQIHPFATQEVVYSAIGRPVLKNALGGYNACLFAYGQTGSGKTYTMTGYDNDHGIVPRLCDDIFALGAGEINVEVSCLEIHNEVVIDLLGGSTALKLRQHPKLGVYADGLRKLASTESAKLQKVIEEAQKRRAVSSTSMNATSSRSHFVVILTVARSTVVEGFPSTLVSKLSLVDLAGSERVSTSQLDGDQLVEGASINKSLSTLGMVFARLADNAEHGRSLPIPFRDSSLTFLLSDSIGGNARTTMIAAISPADYNFEESLSTLRFAQISRRVRNSAIINENPNIKLIRELREEVTLLRAQLNTELKNAPDARALLEEAEAAQRAAESLAEASDDVTDNTDDDGVRRHPDGAVYVDWTRPALHNLCLSSPTLVVVLRAGPNYVTIGPPLAAHSALTLGPPPARGRATPPPSPATPAAPPPSPPTAATPPPSPATAPTAEPPGRRWSLGVGGTAVGGTAAVGGIAVGGTAVGGTAVGSAASRAVRVDFAPLLNVLTVHPHASLVVTVNGRGVAEPTEVGHGDRLVVGPVALRVAHATAAPRAKSFSLRYADLTHVEILEAYHRKAVEERAFAELYKKVVDAGDAPAAEEIDASAKDASAELCRMEEILAALYPPTEEEVRAAASAPEYDDEERDEIIDGTPDLAPIIEDDADYARAIAELESAQLAQRRTREEWEEKLAAASREREQREREAAIAKQEAERQATLELAAKTQMMQQVESAEVERVEAERLETQQNIAAQKSQAETQRALEEEAEWHRKMREVRKVLEAPLPEFKDDVTMWTTIATVSKSQLPFQTDVRAQGVDAGQKGWEGTILKMKQQAMAWESRYAIVAGRFLYYFYRCDGTLRALGALYLLGARAEPLLAAYAGKNYVLRLTLAVPRRVNEARTFYLAFETQPLRDVWAHWTTTAACLPPPPTLLRRLSDECRTVMATRGGALTADAFEENSYLLLLPPNEWGIQVVQTAYEKTTHGKWKSDDLVKACEACETAFTFFRRRHHCRVCGGIFCDICAPKDTVTTDAGDKWKRVCTQCKKEKRLEVRGSRTYSVPPNE